MVEALVVLSFYGGLCLLVRLVHDVWRVRCWGFVVVGLVVGVILIVEGFYGE